VFLIMSDQSIQPTHSKQETVEARQGDRGLIAWLTRGAGKKYERFFVAALGSIPWIGGVMESAFEDTKPYVLTELGKQFVHYVMEDVVPQIGGGQGTRHRP
jgi:hypothetical protein